MNRMPPLNALRAFEAAARHGGYIGASEELNVTRGAISRHVRLLEEHLGVQLFVRFPQGVRLTAAGRQLQPVVSNAFALIMGETERLLSDASELKVICPPGTSIRWLIPKLEDFRSRHPELRVRLTTDFLPDGGFDPVEADVGFSVLNWPSRSKALETQALFPTVLTPACAPGYLKDRSLTSPDVLPRCELLHETRNHTDWKDWASAFPKVGIDPSTGQDFANIDLATKAAVMGIGVVMADLVLCREEIEACMLVAPFPHMMCSSPLGDICLVGGADKWKEPKVKAFRSWAHDAAEADRVSISHLVGD
jgi:DNA-binding transcriptional LysR family regulator